MTLYGPVPAVAVQVSCPVSLPQNGPLAVRLPCGEGFICRLTCVLHSGEPGHAAQKG